MLNSLKIYSRYTAVSFVALLGSSCGLLWTQPPPAGDDFETPFEDLTPELNEAFLRGDEAFEHAFGPSDGLGPLFNDESCAACHPGDGGGTPDTMLIRFGDGTGKSRGEPQLQERATGDVSAEVLPADTVWSPRRPPAVFGMGLIEAIDEEAVVAGADPDDADGDGISGRANRVEPAAWVPAGEVGAGPGPALGRFGWKANVSSLVEQVVLAYQQDMGVTSDFLPEENFAQSGRSIPDPVPEPEVAGTTVLDTVIYVRLLQPPARGKTTGETDRGEQLFADVGCDDCHTPSLPTGDNPIGALANRDVELYSDLLLHDMGPELADGRPDGEATGNEWRTAPLWGLRLAGAFNNGPFFMHDGRAQTISEAIELHGGEGARSRDRYRGLTAADRTALLSFLETL